MPVYYTTNDVVTPSRFIAFPKELLDERFDFLSLDAKLLYSILLDRVSLSIKNDHVDVDGNVYIVYKQESVTELMGWSKRKVVGLFKELEACLMIERKKRGNNLPDLIYVMKVLTDVVDNPVDNYSEHVENNIVSEPTCKNVTQRGAKNASHGSAKFAPVSNTNINNTEYNDTTSIYQEQPKDNVPNPDDERLMDRLSAEQFVKSKIDYDAVVSNLSDNTDRFVCNTIVSVLTEIYSQKSGQVKINGYMIGYSSLREKFLTLNSLHVEYVLECVRNRAADAGPIRNWRAYLVTALYHAESSMDVYYDNLVKFDRYKAMKTQSLKDCGRDLSFLVV